MRVQYIDRRPPGDHRATLERITGAAVTVGSSVEQWMRGSPVKLCLHP
jgi:hypothetical protein